MVYVRRLSFFLLLVILTACATTPSAENAQKATAHYKIGLSYYNESKFQKAFIEFQTALEFNPRDKEVLNAIGVVQLLQFEDFGKAIEYFKKALKVDKDFSEAYNNLGVAYEKIGKIDDAVASYEKAVSNPMYPHPEKAFNNLGRVYYRAGKFDQAIEAYTGALRRLNSFYPSFYGLALCYNAKGFYGDASTALTRAIELDPLFRGNKEKALEDFENKRLVAQGEDAQDLLDYIEILRY